MFAEAQGYLKLVAQTESEPKDGLKELIKQLEIGHVPRGYWEAVIQINRESFFWVAIMQGSKSITQLQKVEVLKRLLSRNPANYSISHEMASAFKSLRDDASIQEEELTFWVECIILTPNYNYIGDQLFETFVSQRRSYATTAALEESYNAEILVWKSILCTVDPVSVEKWCHIPMYLDKIVKAYADYHYPGNFGRIREIWDDAYGFWKQMVDRFHSSPFQVVVSEYLEKTERLMHVLSEF